MPARSQHPHPFAAACALALAMLLCPVAAASQASPTPAPATAVDAEVFAPAYWVARTRNADTKLLSKTQIAARNARLLATDASMHDLATFPATLEGTQVTHWISALASLPTAPRWDEHGALIPAATLATIASNRAINTIPAQQPTRFGLVVRRAALRSFPTDLRVFSRAGDTDIDRFQESAVFPGTPVVIVHTSKDGRWRFVISPRYAAWVQADAVAEGARAAVLGYGQRAPFRVITGAQPRTVLTPERPALSELPLDMGVRVPLAALPKDAQVNGQNAASSWALDLPVRTANGTLAFAPALLPKSADSAADALPLTRANLIQQSFKFLGERYGWGHAYNGRDCSGFVSEVYRSMGVLLPRNTSAQAASPEFQRILLQPSDTRAHRMAVLATLDVGDLIYIPGHVVMLIGRIDGQPWVIHDINGGRLKQPDGRVRAMHYNGVVVTPLLPLRFDADHDYIDRITAIVKVTSVKVTSVKVTAAS